MDRCKYLLPFVGLLTACGGLFVVDDSNESSTTAYIDTISTSSVGETETSASSVVITFPTTETLTNPTSSDPADEVCVGEPYSELFLNIVAWVHPNCIGPVAGGKDSSGLPCIKWELSGEIYCVDLNQPVDKIYYINTNNGNCEEWVTTNEPWYVWKYCGNQTN